MNKYKEELEKHKDLPPKTRIKQLYKILHPDKGGNKQDFDMVRKCQDKLVKLLENPNYVSPSSPPRRQPYNHNMRRK